MPLIASHSLSCLELPPSSGTCILDENAGNKNACLNNAPGLSTEFAFEVCLQPLRIALIYTAACMLFFPCHPVKGGEEALIALEDARLDLADGMRALIALLRTRASIWQTVCEH